MKKSIYTLAVFLFSIGVAMGCRDDKKTAGEKIEDGIENTGDKIEEGAEEIEDEIDDATDDN